LTVNSARKRGGGERKTLRVDILSQTYHYFEKEGRRKGRWHLRWIKKLAKEKGGRGKVKINSDLINAGKKREKKNSTGRWLTLRTGGEGKLVWVGLLLTLLN